MGGHDGLGEVGVVGAWVAGVGVEGLEGGFGCEDRYLEGEVAGEGVEAVEGTEDV